MYQAAKERTSADTEYFDTAISTLQSSLDSLKTRESKLLDTFLAEQISKDLYDSKILDLHNERVSIQKQISELKSKHPVSTLEPTKEFFLRGSRAAKEFLAKNDYGKKEILESLLWNLSITSGNVAQIKYKSPYDIMAKADKNADFQTLCPGQDLNLQGLLHTHLKRTRIPNSATWAIPDSIAILGLFSI